MPAYNNPALQKGTTPSVIAAPSADSYILGSTVLADNPQLLPMYFRQSLKKPMTTLSRISALGMGTVNKDRAVSGPVTGHYEKPRVNRTITVGAVGTVTGASVIITLSTNDMYAEVSPSGTNNWSTPMLHDVYMFGTSGINYIVENKDITSNPHKLTLRADKTTIVPTTEIIVGAKGSWVANVKGEAMGLPDSERSLRFKYQNTFAITAVSNTTSGSHLTTEVSFKTFKDSNILVNDDIQNLEYKNEVAKSNLWMFGNQATGWNQTSTIIGQVGVPGTQGLYNFALENGFISNYNPSTFTEADIYNIANYFQRIRIESQDVMMLMGNKIDRLMEKYWAGKYNYNWVVGLSDKYMGKVNRGSGDGQDFSENGLWANLGITGFTMGNLNFLKVNCPEFSDQNGMGAIGFDGIGIVAPFGNSAEAEGKPYLGFEYRGADGYNRLNELTIKAGAGNGTPAPLSNLKSTFVRTWEVDAQQVGIRSEIAGHFSLGEQFVVVKPS